MKNLTRRTLLSAAAPALLASVLLGGCTRTMVNGTITITIDVEKIINYVQAGLNAAQVVGNILVEIPGLSGYYDKITDVSKKLQDASDVFTKETNGQLTITYVGGSVKAAVDSILNIIMQIASLIGSVIRELALQNLSVSSGTVSRVNVIEGSLRTIILLFKALLSSPVQYATNNVSEYKALKTLGV